MKRTVYKKSHPAKTRVDFVFIDVAPVCAGRPGDSTRSITLPSLTPSPRDFSYHYNFFYHTLKFSNMKRKFFSMISAAALLVAVAFTGCSREGTTKDDGPRTVFLKIASAETKAVGTAVAAGDEVAISDGLVLFTNGSGVVEVAWSIASATDPGNLEVSVTDLTSGYQIQNVPGSAQNVYVLANLTGAWTPVGTPYVGKNISAFLGANLSVVALKDASGGTTEIPLSGVGAIVPDATDYKADITVAPVAGRIEFNKIIMPVSVSDNGTGHVTEFTVKNIFINNYFATSTIGGTAPALNTGTVPVNNGAVVANYKVGDSPGTYPTSAVSALYDVLGVTVDDQTDLLGDAKHFGAAAGSSKTWAYNLLAPTIAGSTAITSAQFPHIIVELTVDAVDDVAYNDYVDETWFLTVSHFVPSTVANPTVADYLKFEPGKVYQLDATYGLSFDLEDLFPTPEPEDTTKKVTATVTVRPWEIVSVNPVF